MIKTIEKIVTKELFEPSILGIFLNPFYIARRGLLIGITKFGKEITGKTLDVGCGTKPYEKYFCFSEYVGLEIDTTLNREKKKADYFYDGHKFPFKDSEFDSVVTNQVFEHVFNPDEFLTEVNRVLKKGGKFFLTVPFVWDEHEQPYDYARYSSFGLRSILEKNGFILNKHVKSVDDFRVLAQIFNAYIYKITHKNRILKIISNLFIMSLASLIGILLGYILPKNEDLYLDNIVLAEKVKDLIRK